MIFSNNMDYEDGSIEPLQGAFYSTTSFGKPHQGAQKSTKTGVVLDFSITSDTN